MLVCLLHVFIPLRGSEFRLPRIEGRRASLRYALAPGYHISRLRRWLSFNALSSFSEKPLTGL
jgi:hypothetical protein